MGGTGGIMKKSNSMNKLKSGMQPRQREYFFKKMDDVVKMPLWNKSGMDYFWKLETTGPHDAYSVMPRTNGLLKSGEKVTLEIKMNSNI